MKRKSYVARLGALALALTLVSSCLVGGTLARYVSEVTGTAKATVAAWSFKANGQVATMNAIDLASTAYTDATVASGVIAPGTSGSFDIELDGTGSQVGIDYTVDLKTGTDIVLPDDFKFTVDNVEKTSAEMKTGINVTGNIKQSSQENEMKKVIKVTWEWPFGENDTTASNDTNDNAYAGKTWTLNIVATGKQVAPASTTPAS